eukprot:CAMPEP_0202956326 /NCGR_PEP_ID=MMETSP1396-20130829/828_1 /ASSEMBLY_ACC=CAM_ASM_000872 /TAXON_ID= /ORGANISM="Pseudokeronopsis sp., Strain Brazil" /LENGTH=120 /DNA_ID=CAMNT_0049673281 /DNA_START=117 /DNA_END=479 /DNA_ORIENTATION=+
MRLQDKSKGMNGIFSPAVPGTTSYYFYGSSVNYLVFQLEEAVVFNTMHLVFYDFDNRSYTWWGDYSLDGATWTPFANGRSGKGSEYLRFGFDINAKFLRFKGYNTKNDDFHIIGLDLDYF